MPPRSCVHHGTQSCCGVSMLAVTRAGQVSPEEGFPYRILSEKNRHEAAAYATMHSGLHKRTCVPTLHQKKPKYAGWRRTPYNQMQTARNRHHHINNRHLQKRRSLGSVVSICGALLPIDAVRDQLVLRAALCAKHTRPHQPCSQPLERPPGQGLGSAARAPVSTMCEKFEPAVMKAAIRTPCPTSIRASPAVEMAPL